MLIDDRDAHVLGCAFDLAHGRFDGVAVQVWHFDFRDFAYVGFGDLADLIEVRFGGTLLDLGRLHEKSRDRSGFEDEVIGTIFIQADDGRDNFAEAILCCIVDALTEFGDVHTVLTEGRTERGSRSGAAADDLDLDHGLNFLSHMFGYVSGGEASAYLRNSEWFISSLLE